MEYYVDTKIMKNAVCSNVDGPKDYHTQWSKSDKDSYMLSLIVESKTIEQMNLLNKTETDSQT